MITTVVNLHHGKDYDVYIGRPSEWGNEFIIGKDGDREEVLEKYKKLAIKNGVPNKARALKGKILGCFCKPKACHGDLLAKWAEK